MEKKFEVREEKISVQSGSVKGRMEIFAPMKVF